uniref:Uncharacterized protein n=1 Tax=Opuntia streptacantha TaxID=393608 RepID=A0A7C8YET9_OPUST
MRKCRKIANASQHSKRRVHKCYSCESEGLGDGSLVCTNISLLKRAGGAGDGSRSDVEAMCGEQGVHDLPMISFGDGRKLIDWGIDFTEVDFNSVTCDKASSPARAYWAPTIVHVSRPEEVESKRKDLRVAMKEYDMMEAVNQKTCDYTC